MKTQRLIADPRVRRTTPGPQLCAVRHSAVTNRKQHAVRNAALLACVFALSVSAQPRPAGLSPLEGKPRSDGVIVVQVSDSLGAPLSGTVVVLRQNMTVENQQPIVRHATSDTAGRARFTDLPNGGYAAEATRAGCSLAPSNTNDPLLEGAKAEGQIHVILRRRPVITGRVVDERGTPLHNAHVQVFRRAFQDGEESLVSGSRGQSTTDDRGIYRLNVDEPGRYWVMAYHMEALFPRGSAPRPTGLVFYPNSPDLLSAMRADLAFDQPETTLDITLPPAARTEIAAGILSGPEGRPCTRCRFSLQRVEGPYRYELSSGGTGRDAGFDTRGVPPGQYRVYVEDQGANQGWWAVEEATLIEDRTTGLTMRTRPPIPVSGRVTYEDPPTLLPDQDSNRPASVFVQLSQVGRHFFGTRDSSTGQAQLSFEQSEFTVGPLAPERFRFQVFVQGANGYLAGLTRQGRELTSPVLDLSQPGPWTNLEARVAFKMAEPQFRIPASASPAAREPGYQLVLIPDPKENPFGSEASGGCGPDGNCYMSIVPPGRYWVLAFPATSPSPTHLRGPGSPQETRALGSRSESQCRPKPKNRANPGPRKGLHQPRIAAVRTRAPAVFRAQLIVPGKGPAPKPWNGDTIS
jgi:hypothetical protein